jgi:hypothetical protein
MSISFGGTEAVMGSLGRAWHILLCFLQGGRIREAPLSCSSMDGNVCSSSERQKRRAFICTQT